jgi:putative transposase
LRRHQQDELEKELIVQEVIKIREKQKKVGTRRLLIHLEPFLDQHQLKIGRDSLFNLLAENKLLVRKRKRRIPVTTFSNHWFRKYPNLIIGMLPLAAHQLWVSDITYIRLSEREHAYLSLVTDAYSRKIVGYYLSKDLSAEGCIKALRKALAQLPEGSKLIHHSDRGCQYCSFDYVALLQDNNIRISMTQSGDPLENAIAERVNGILK